MYGLSVSEVSKWVERVAKAIEYHGDRQVEAAKVSADASADASRRTLEALDKFTCAVKEEDDDTSTS